VQENIQENIQEKVSEDKPIIEQKQEYYVQENIQENIQEKVSEDKPIIEQKQEYDLQKQTSISEINDVDKVDNVDRDIKAIQEMSEYVIATNKENSADEKEEKIEVKSFKEVKAKAEEQKVDRSKGIVVDNFTKAKELESNLKILLHKSFYDPEENESNITNLENKIVERIRDGNKTCYKDIIKIAKKNLIPFLNPNELKKNGEKVDEILHDMYYLYNTPSTRMKNAVKRIGIAFATLVAGIGIAYGSLYIKNNYPNEIKKVTAYTYETAESIERAAKRQIENKVKNVKHKIKKVKVETDTIRKKLTKSMQP
jgi:hypothetical protein